MNKRTRMLSLSLVAGALALSIGLFGCGGQSAQPAEPTQAQEVAQAEPTQEEQKQKPAATATENASSSETASPEAAPAPEAAAPAQDSTKATESYIGNDEAKRIALNHAGINEADTYDFEVDLDFDDAVIHYDVEFKSGGMEYSYDIDPVTGAIISFDSEIDD